MSSSDPWSCGSRRRRSERGPLHRRPEDQLPGATHADLPAAWRLVGMVLQVGSARPRAWPAHRHRAAPERGRRRRGAGIHGARGLHGSPRLHRALRESGWLVSEKTVAASMRRQGLVARRIRRRHGLTRQDKTAPKFPDLLKRDFTAAAPNTRWVGDMTEIRTAAGKLYLATVIDLYSRRLLGAATGLHPDADLACQAIKMAVTARGGADRIRGVIFHTDRGSTYTANAFTKLCRRLDISQSMGLVGSCFDNAAAEAFFSSLEWEVLSRHQLTDPDHARAVSPALVLRLLQPTQAAQQRTYDEPDQLRDPD